MKMFIKVLIVFCLFISIVPAQGIEHNAESIAQSKDAVFLQESSIQYQVSAIKNVPDQPVLPIGVQETRDVAALYFKLYETYLKASADSQVNFSDVPLLLGPAMLLIPAFSGATNIVAELQNMTDDQIKSLLMVADEYELGNHAQRAKQIFKTVLVLAQTYFVFIKASTQ